MESRTIVAAIPKKTRMPTILRIVTPTLPSLFASMARHPIERNKQQPANGPSLVVSNPANKKKKAVIIDSGASTSKAPIWSSTLGRLIRSVLFSPSSIGTQLEPSSLNCNQLSRMLESTFSRTVVVIRSPSLIESLLIASTPLFGCKTS